MTAEEVGEAKQTIPIEGEDISPKKDGGVLKIIKKEGYEEETPMIGDKVSVHYVGTLLDGTKFDSSRDRDNHFTFDLGKGQVIKAWDIGVATMKIGEVCQLICKPDYAYGSAGSPPKIPTNATLVFEVELFDFKSEDLSENEDCGIIRRILKKGEGYSKPNDGATVEVFLEGKFEGKVFDSRELKFQLGEGEALSVPVGIERAIQNMEKEEEALITLKPRYGFHTSGNPEFNIPPNATLNYVVKLKAFEKAKDSWEMNITEKLEQGSIVKEKGTQYFKEGKYKHAAGQYKKIILWLEMESGLTEEEEQKSRALQLAAHLNMAMCSLKVQEFTQALESCNKALEMDSSNEKALFRRSEAYFSMKEFEEARQGFQKVVQLYPSNKAAKAQVVACQRHIKDQHEKDKRLYANMFQRFAEQDAKKEAEKVKDTKSQDIQEEDVNIEENSDEMKDEHGQ